MQYIEPLITCDRILELYNEQKTSGYKHADFIEKLGFKIGSPESQIVLTAINRLEDDNHLKIYGNSNDLYKLGGDALIFKASGGYKGFIEKENKKEEIREIIEGLTINTGQSVIDTNQSVRDTNLIQQRNIRLNEKLFWITLFVAAAGAIASWVSVINVNENRNLKYRVQTQDTLIQSLQKQLLQIKNAAYPQIKAKDSLNKSDSALKH